MRCSHTELVSCAGWTSPDEVYSAGDDHQVLRWNLLTNESSLLAKLPDDVYPTSMHWFPKAGASKKGNASDVFALSSTDGKLLHPLDRMICLKNDNIVQSCLLRSTY